MKTCNCPHCQLQKAAKSSDRALLSYAFSILGEENGGHDSPYGLSHGGAAACYITRVGDREELATLRKAIATDPRILENARTGLWDELEVANDLLIYIFSKSDEAQRMDTLEILDIEDSENTDVAKLTQKLLESDLRAAERKRLLMTQRHENWA